MAVLVGVPIGIVSRLVDTAPWAPSWIGNILSPWLAASWVAGSAVPGRLWIGAAAGVALLAGVSGAYLALAGPDMARLILPLAALTVLGGIIWGAAGRAWRSGGRRRVLAAAVLLAAIIADLVTILSA